MAGMKAIKPEANADAYWFLAQHPRGVQPLWLEYFKNRIYKLRSGHPNFNEGAVEIQAIVEDTDKDARHRRLNHTRFRFHPISSVEHQAEVLHEIKEHPLTESLQVSIYEEKFNRDMFKGITPATVREFLQKLFFDRLTQSINFVDEVQKAMELLTIFNPSVKYNPLKVITNLTIEMDNKENSGWLKTMLDWQEMDGTLTNSNGEITQSLATALTEIAWVTGYPEWIVGRRDLIHNKPTNNDDIVNLKCYFNTRRMCVGLEILTDEEFHPFLEYTVSNKNASLCAYVAQIMAPKPGQLILDLSMNVQDYMMAIFHNYDYLTYINVVDNQSQYNYAKWNADQMKKFCKRFTSKYTNHHDFIHIKDWTQIEHQDILLSQVDRLILPIPYMERPFTEDLEELLLYIKMDYDVVLRIANKMPLGSRIMLLFNRIDADYVLKIMIPDIASLHITWSRTIFDREEYVVVVEVEKVPPPAPPSPLLGRLEQASLLLSDYVQELERQPPPMKMEVPEAATPVIPMIQLDLRKPRPPPPPPKPLKPLGIVDGKIMLPPNWKGTPRKIPEKPPTVQQKTPEAARPGQKPLPLRFPRLDPNLPGPSNREILIEPLTPIDEPLPPVPPPMEPPLRTSTRIQGRSPRQAVLSPPRAKVPRIEEPSMPPPFPRLPPPPMLPSLLQPAAQPLLKTPVKYPVKLKKSPRIQQQQEQQKTPQAARIRELPPPSDQLFLTRVPVQNITPPAPTAPGPSRSRAPQVSAPKIATPSKKAAVTLSTLSLTTPPRDRRPSPRAEPPQTRIQASKGGEALLKSPGRVQPMRSPRHQGQSASETPTTKAQTSAGPSSRSRPAPEATAAGPSRSRAQEPPVTSSRTQNPPESTLTSPGRGRKPATESTRAGTSSIVTSPGRTRATAALSITAASGSRTGPKTPAQTAKAPESSSKSRGREAREAAAAAETTLRTPKAPAVRHSPRTQQKRSSKRIAAKEKDTKKESKKKK